MTPTWPPEWTSAWCPRCDAGIGEPCRSLRPARGPLRYPHRERGTFANPHGADMRETRVERETS